MLDGLTCCVMCNVGVCCACQSVVESDPQYVIRRFESGRYAINADVRLVYQRALELTEVSVMSSVLSSV